MKKLFILLFVLIFPISIFSMSNEDFQAWWQKYRDNEKIPKELKVMEDRFIKDDLLQYSSNYWNFLNQQNIIQVTCYGYENFKQTVTRNYFTWVVNLDNQYAKGLVDMFPTIPITLPQEELDRVHSLFPKDSCKDYNLITQYLLNYVIKIGGEQYLQKLEEPNIGNPPWNFYNGKKISQDILNSLIEYLFVTKNCSLPANSTIIEIGAGCGRTAFCFLSIMPHVKYIIVDFPPALYISQKYLTAIFPNKKVLKFRKFQNFEEISKKFAEADIIFLMPDQLELLPANIADLFLAIDCLHEMKPERINYYFNKAERLSKFLYYKCWQYTVVPYDNYVYTSDSYPVHNNWACIFKEPCVVPSAFFHALYDMHPRIGTDILFPLKQK